MPRKAPQKLRGSGEKQITTDNPHLADRRTQMPDADPVQILLDTHEISTATRERRHSRHRSRGISLEKLQTRGEVEEPRGMRGMWQLASMCG